MVINQNVVVWNQKHQKHRGGGGFSLCSEFRYHSENARHSEIQIFVMHSNFRYDRKILLA